MPVRRAPSVLRYVVARARNQSGSGAAEDRLTLGQPPRVTGLFIYPLKGAAGIPLQDAELDGLGFVQDRRWMVVDAGGEFVSQRTRPALALVRPELCGDALVLRTPGRDACVLPLGESGPGSEPVRVWRDTVTAVPAGDRADAWISDVLGGAFRLVRFAADAVRPVDPRYATSAGERVAFVDGYPCLLVGEGSLEELNRRLERPLPMDRFRPNVVVGGTRPHEEDGWRRIRIGDVAFSVVKPCARCVVTTVDQSTGVASPEPLRALAGYRNMDGKVLFGQNLIHAGPGTVRIGDAVDVRG